jgi:hypothetical protein
VDGPLTRLPPSPFRRVAARFDGEPLSDTTLLECLEAWEPGGALRGRYRAETLGWLLGMLRRKLRGLRAVRVRDGGRTIGWYLYGREREIAQVLRLHWAPGRFHDVQRQLLADALRDGAAAVSGRLSTRLLGELDDRLCVLRRAPWVLVHSRSRAARDALARGDADLDRMDGEWWIPG